MQTTTPQQQPELALDHTPALELAMRALFDTKWRQWHRHKRYEDAVADPVTRQLLCLTVQRQASAPTARRRRQGAGHEER